MFILNYYRLIKKLRRKQNRKIMKCKKSQGKNYKSQGSKQAIQLKLSSKFISRIMPKINKQQDDENYIEIEYKQYRKYRKQTKQKFCHMVCREGKTINAAARLLHINEATAKTIMKDYREMHPEEIVPVARPGRKPKDRSKKRQIILPTPPRINETIKAEQEPLPLVHQPISLPLMFPLPLPGFLFLPPLLKWEDPAVKQE